MLESSHLVCSSPAIGEAVDAQNHVVDTATCAGMRIDVPQDVQDAMSEACMDAGGALEKYNKFVCSIKDGGTISFHGMSMCRADNRSCKSLEANGGVMGAMMEMSTADAGMNCDIVSEVISEGAVLPWALACLVAAVLFLTWQVSLLLPASWSVSNVCES